MNYNTMLGLIDYTIIRLVNFLEFIMLERREDGVFWMGFLFMKSLTQQNLYFWKEAANVFLYVFN